MELQTVGCVTYPHLFKMFLDVAGIPSSNCWIEREFSKAGDLITAKCLSLSAEQVRQCMCLKLWSDRGFWDFVKYWEKQDVRK